MGQLTRLISAKAIYTKDKHKHLERLHNISSLLVELMD